MSEACLDATSTAGAAPHLSHPPPKKPVKSHHAYAGLTLDHLTVHGWRPVFHHGQLYVLDPETAVWMAIDRQELSRLVAELNDGKPNCNRWTDYAGITEQALAIATDTSFFDAAPIGIACGGSFYRVDGDRVLVEPLAPRHRQRVMLDVEPFDSPTPLFDQFMHETFQSDVEGEEQQQRQLVQEISGAALLGVMPRFQKAVLFYDPYGRAGKGTMERIISQLVPPAFTSAVSPFKWDKEYYIASLTGSRLNVVGELPEGETIPSASFKSVLGGDLLAGRQPTKPVVTFRNEATHLFTSNHLISTKDHSEAFFARWLLVEFPNSLMLTGRPIDTGLAPRIISNELAGIAHWALQGGLRLLKQGSFSASVVHDRLMQRWRRASNSLDEFLYEACELTAEGCERRSAMYGAYKAWCHRNGRKPYSKARAKEYMEHRVGLDVRFTVLNGIEVIRGLTVHEDFKDSLTAM